MSHQNGKLSKWKMTKMEDDDRCGNGFDQLNTVLNIHCVFSSVAQLSHSLFTFVLETFSWKRCVNFRHFDHIPVHLFSFWKATFRSSEFCLYSLTEMSQLVTICNKIRILLPNRMIYFRLIKYTMSKSTRGPLPVFGGPASKANYICNRGPTGLLLLRTQKSSSYFYVIFTATIWLQSQSQIVAVNIT